jgi:hypothetical protein
MFTKKPKQRDSLQISGKPKQESLPRLKYAQPKILLIDMEDSVEASLAADGYNVANGSFGMPYKVPKEDQLRPVILNGHMPENYTEREIVIIDLTPRKPLDEPSGEKTKSMGENDSWASCSDGVIDPRPNLMVRYKKDFDRILEHGGIFIIFADAYLSQEQFRGRIENRYLVKETKLDLNNWSFLHELGSSNFAIQNDHGEEIQVNSTESSLGSYLAQHAKTGRFTCSFSPRWGLNDKWISLATNKFGMTVAGGLVVSNKDYKGLVLIFPQIEDKLGFISKILKDALSLISPHLFPHLEGARWIQRSEYELPTVLELRSQIVDIQAQARTRIADLEQAIEVEQNEFGYLHDLIRESGTPLVAAVKKTLELIGFASVVDVDEQMEKLGNTGPRREDIQIHDNSPLMLIEVKGIVNLPREASTLQVWKYLIPRMKDLNRTDIRGLAIINHQRNIPALERENLSPFQEDVLTNAKEQGFGLLTTWDLFRLARSYVRNGWKHEYVSDLFYRDGRIEPVPVHYEFVGVIRQFWEKAHAIGVQIEVAEICVGDRIAFEHPVEFQEQVIESLQVDRQATKRINAGNLAGIETSLDKMQAKEGTRVYRVRQSI